MSFLPFGRRLPAVDTALELHDLRSAPAGRSLTRLARESRPFSFRFWGEEPISLGLEAFAPRPIASVPQNVGTTPGAFSAAYQSDILLQNLVSLGREYSPSEVNSFRRQARGGDGRRYYAFLDEVKRLVVHAPLKRLWDGVAGSDTQFTTPVAEWDGPEDASAPAAAARAVRDYVSEQWRPWLRIIKRALASADYYGIAGCRVETTVRGAAGGRERISLVEQVPARRFKVDVVTGKWVVQFHPNSGEWLYVDDLVATGELIFWEVDPADPLDQRGCGWVALIPWVIAQYTLRWYALKVELTAMPQRTGEFDPTQDGHKELVEGALRNQAASSWVAYPTGSKIDVSQPPTMGGANDPHQTLWDTMRREIDLVILGHAQASDVKVGAGSIQSTSSAQAIVDERVNSLADEISKGPLAVAVRGSVRRNFGEAAAVPVVSSALKKVEDPEILSRVAVNLKQAGAGHRVSVDDLVRRCLGRVAKDGEENLGAAPGTAAEAKPAETAVQAAAARLLFGAEADEEDPAEGIAKRAVPRARRALEPLFAAVDRATDGDDLETIQRQLQQLAGVIGSAALEAGTRGVASERAALGRIG